MCTLLVCLEPHFVFCITQAIRGLAFVQFWAEIIRASSNFFEARSGLFSTASLGEVGGGWLRIFLRFEPMIAHIQAIPILEKCLSGVSSHMPSPFHTA